MKFLTDAMFGKLTHLLRILGYDTVYAEDIERSAPDDKLLDYAKQNDRLIITRDLPFHIRAKDHTFYIKEEDPYIVLRILGKKFKLNFDFNINNARCSVCNSQLEEVDNKTKIKDKVQSDTYIHYNEFYQCLNSECSKIYWKGTHVEDIIEKLRKTFQTN